MLVYYCACWHVGLAHSPLFGVDWGDAHVVCEGVAGGSGAVALPLLTSVEREHGTGKPAAMTRSYWRRHMELSLVSWGAYHRALGETPTRLHDVSSTDPHAIRTRCAGASRGSALASSLASTSSCSPSSPLRSPWVAASLHTCWDPMAIIGTGFHAHQVQGWQLLWFGCVARGTTHLAGVALACFPCLSSCQGRGDPR